MVATVNGTDITLGEVIIAASQLPPQYQQLPPDILFAGVTDQLVQQELLAQTMTDRCRPASTSRSPTSAARCSPAR